MAKSLACAPTEPVGGPVVTDNSRANNRTQRPGQLLVALIRLGGDPGIKGSSALEERAPPRARAA